MTKIATLDEFLADEVWAQRTPHGWRLAVRVQPGARRSEVIGTHGDALRVRVAAPAVDGKANEALVEIIAAHFGIHRRMIAISRGHTSRSKVIEITVPG